MSRWDPHQLYSESRDDNHGTASDSIQRKNHKEVAKPLT